MPPFSEVGVHRFRCEDRERRRARATASSVTAVGSAHRLAAQAGRLDPDGWLVP